MIFFHHKLIIIVFIDQSFLIYGISMRGILNLIIPLQRHLYLKIKSKYYFLKCLNPTNVFLYSGSLLQFRIAGNFIYVGFADNFMYVGLLVFSGISYC